MRCLHFAFLHTSLAVEFRCCNGIDVAYDGVVNSVPRIVSLFWFTSGGSAECSPCCGGVPSALCFKAFEDSPFRTSYIGDLDGAFFVYMIPCAGCTGENPAVMLFAGKVFPVRSPKSTGQGYSCSRSSFFPVRMPEDLGN